jgi:amino acid adenylation domain-containing protein
MGTGNHGRLPLSSAQKGVWFAHLQDPTGRRYTCAEYLVLDGPLDRELFGQAWSALCAQAAVLRVRRIEEAGDAGLAQVLGTTALDLPDVDLRASGAPDEAASAWMHRDLDTPVDLATGPVSRAALLRVDDDRHLLYLRMHHAVTDGHSMHVLQTALAESYTALVLGKERTSPPLGDLADFVAKDAAYRGSEDFELDRAFWTKRFADRPEPMRVPAVLSDLSDRDDSAIRARHVAALPDADLLVGAAAGLGTTWQLALIAATAAFLQRVTGRRDVVLGLASNARRGIAARRTPTMAANTLPLRLDVSPSTTLRRLLPSVADEVGTVQRHERFRYDDLCRALGVPAAEEGPLGPILNFMPYARELRFGDATASAVNLASGPSIDLTYAVTGSAQDGLTVSVDADPALHRPDGLAADLDRWTAFVRATLTDPDRDFRSIDLLTEAERDEVLVRRNDTARARATHTVVDLVREVAMARPDSVAVSGGGRSLTYAELDARAGALAALLAERGVRREDVVGIGMSRSPDLIVAMLAVLRAGGAYLPLDLTYPRERLRYIVTDSAPRCVIVSDPGAASAVLPDGVAMVDVRARPAAPGGGPVAIDPAGAANVIYTSGSTGTPKGVVASHEALANLAVDHRDRFGLDADSSLLQYVSPAFDAASGDIWPGLAGGARLVLPPEPASLTLADLTGLLRAERITHVALPPSMLAQLPSDDLPDLVHLVTGGEPTDPRVVDRWADGRRMMNMYGPTETCCAATGGEMVPGETATIGVPIENVAAYVLDGDLQPVVPGAAGELYVSGIAVARGYLNQPALTAGRFLPCPFGPPGARMYRTGDRVHHTKDGSLQYLGRTDHQVKIRGFRVELGEIESALAADSRVAKAIVMAKGARSGGKYLAGYVMPRPGVTVDADELRDRLHDVLPAYMVPALIVVLDAFPLQPNGKLDREALPDPAATRQATGRPPATADQAALCGMFAEVLGVDGIGVHDSFFAHGGDSILVLRLVSAARAAGLVLTSRQVFEHPTVAELADVVRREPSEQAVADDGTGSLPAPPIVHWALELGPIDGFHQSVSVRVPAGAGHDRLAKVLGLVVDRHPALRARLADERILRVAPPGGAHDVLTTADVIGLAPRRPRPSPTSSAAPPPPRCGPRRAGSCARCGSTLARPSRARCCSCSTTSPWTGCPGTSCSATSRTRGRWSPTTSPRGGRPPGPRCEPGRATSPRPPGNPAGRRSRRCGNGSWPPATRSSAAASCGTPTPSPPRPRPGSRCRPTSQARC